MYCGNKCVDTWLCVCPLFELLRQFIVLCCVDGFILKFIVSNIVFQFPVSLMFICVLRSCMRGVMVSVCVA